MRRRVRELLAGVSAVLFGVVSLVMTIIDGRRRR